MSEVEGLGLTLSTVGWVQIGSDPGLTCRPEQGKSSAGLMSGLGRFCYAVKNYCTVLPKLEKTVDASTRQTSLTDLKTSTVYSIKVLAFTSVGDGPASPALSVTTAEDSK